MVVAARAARAACARRGERGQDLGRRRRHARDGGDPGRLPAGACSSPSPSAASPAPGERTAASRARAPRWTRSARPPRRARARADARGGRARERRAAPRATGPPPGRAPRGRRRTRGSAGARGEARGRGRARPTAGGPSRARAKRSWERVRPAEGEARAPSIVSAHAAVAKAVSRAPGTRGAARIAARIAGRIAAREFRISRIAACVAPASPRRSRRQLGSWYRRSVRHSARPLPPLRFSPCGSRSASISSASSVDRSPRRSGASRIERARPRRRPAPICTPRAHALRRLQQAQRRRERCDARVVRRALLVAPGAHGGLDAARGAASPGRQQPRREPRAVGLHRRGVGRLKLPRCRHRRGRVGPALPRGAVGEQTHLTAPRADARAASSAPRSDAVSRRHAAERGGLAAQGPASAPEVRPRADAVGAEGGRALGGARAAGGAGAADGLRGRARCADTTPRPAKGFRSVSPADGGRRRRAPDGEGSPRRPRRREAVVVAVAHVSMPRSRSEALLAANSRNVASALSRSSERPVEAGAGPGCSCGRGCASGPGSGSGFGSGFASGFAFGSGSGSTSGLGSASRSGADSGADSTIPRMSSASAKMSVTLSLFALGSAPVVVASSSSALSPRRSSRSLRKPSSSIGSSAAVGAALAAARASAPPKMSSNSPAPDGTGQGLSGAHLPWHRSRICRRRP